MVDRSRLPQCAAGVHCISSLESHFSILAHSVFLQFPVASVSQDPIVSVHDDIEFADALSEIDYEHEHDLDDNEDALENDWEHLPPTPSTPSTSPSTTISTTAASTPKPKHGGKLQMAVTKSVQKTLGFFAGWIVPAKPVEDFTPEKSDAESSSTARPCPFYKKIEGTSFAMDAFRYGKVAGITAYFLSHFHSDHYGGLTGRWSHGPIYCNLVTANLIKQQLRAPEKLVHVLPMAEPVTIQGVTITLMDANHCPGACIFLFQLGDGRVHLHTGDFRFHPSMLEHPAMHEVRHKLGIVYLDTTYMNPKYVCYLAYSPFPLFASSHQFSFHQCFPSQLEVLEFVAVKIREEIARKPRALIVVGTYSIGKEKVLLSISQALGGAKIYANERKRRIFSCFEWPELTE